VELPRALDLDRLERAAEERGLLFTRGDLFWLAPDGVARLLLSVAQVPRERIEEGVALLAGLADREAGAARKASA
jgi:DNA-binding transcriptional MocR family regulator